MWPTPTPYPTGNTELPDISALDTTGTVIAEELVAGYNVVSGIPAFMTIGYLFVVIVFFFCLWTIKKHWKQVGND
jgi:hypothetical protein